MEEAIDDAIKRTLPDGPARRHAKLFELARFLKAIPALADAPRNDLKPIVERWHSAASTWTSTPFDETWFDFTEGWAKVLFPAGAEPIRQAFARAENSTPPDVAANYELPAIRSLIALCRELQRSAGASPFFLTNRVAGELLVVHFTTAARYLRGLSRDGILRVEAAGDYKKHKASRYRYLAPLHDGPAERDA